MRNEAEMMKLILNTAKEDDRILAVYMNGSRANQHIKRDLFQDYDIVYVVTDTAPFYEDKAWIQRFGDTLYLQMPEEMDRISGHAYDFSKSYGWLMQFADGNRMDLHVMSLEAASKDVMGEKLTVILLDKANCLPDIEPASDSDFHVKPPTASDFLCCCNEFWWCLNNLGKGIWRRETLYVMDMLNFHVRPQLLRMLSWYAGISVDFSVSFGKSAKYINEYLPEDIYQRLLCTYPAASIPKMRDAIRSMCLLFDETAQFVAREFEFPYNHEEADNSFAFFERSISLPKDAQEIL